MIFFWQCVPLRILALFTSGYNSVGTGDSEYRLGRVVLPHSFPPPRSGRGGGSVVVVTDLSHLPPGSMVGGRLDAGRRSDVVCWSLSSLSCAPFSSLIRLPICEWHISRLGGDPQSQWQLFLHVCRAVWHSAEFLFFMQISPPKM